MVVDKGLARSAGLSEAEAAEEAAAGEAATAAEEELGVQNIAQAQEEMGEMAGKKALGEQGFESSEYINPIRPHGFDDIVIKDGKYSVVEYKGGLNARLDPGTPTRPPQLSQEWFEQKLAEMRRYGGADGEYYASLLEEQGRVDVLLIETKGTAETTVTHFMSYLGNPIP